MQHGIHDFLTDKPIDSPPQGQAAPPASFAQEVMISDVLAKAGYRCGYVGKWHMGNDASPGHGYEFTNTMLGGSSPYQNPTMSRNGKPAKESGYLTELMTSAACEYLDQQKPGQPFFLTVGYFDPHTPYDGHPQKYYDMYANTRFETTGGARAPNALREKEMLTDIVGNLRKCAASVPPSTIRSPSCSPRSASSSSRTTHSSSSRATTASSSAVTGSGARGWPPTRSTCSKRSSRCRCWSPGPARSLWRPRVPS
jgi:hypothetical protein